MTSIDEKSVFDAPLGLLLDDVSPATKLLEKRKEMVEVQEALDAQKSEYGKREESFRAREENLRKKDIELQEALVLFNKFLKENEAKRRRADRRANEEIKQREQKEREIELREEKLSTLQEKCGKLREEVTKNDQYQAYLKRVQTENATEYPDIESVLTRYHCLMDAHKDLMKKQTELSELHETKRNEFIAYLKDQHKANLIANNDIARLSKELEEAVKRRTVIEEKMESTLKAETARTLKISQIIMAVDNIYQRCKKSSKILNHTKTIEQVNSNGTSKKSEKSAASSVPANAVSLPGSPSNAAAMMDTTNSAPVSPTHSSPPMVSSPTSRGNAVKNAPADVQQAMSLRRQIESKLEVIANYLIDYTDIVDEYGSQ